VLLQQLEDAARILERVVDFVPGGLRVGLIGPLRLVVLLLLLVVAGEQAVVEVVLLADDERGVGNAS